ncbi:LysR family transcriptional regulator [Williamsia sterculiae]|uniref:DNA-binding transcriptional regulator, LysR family n=1 Tax=Williamsia sterculiae TaxID=1344003 RepID=A0A1N7H5Q6_9NOCA|nr:LysR family transcriptional regulator [Williamsia sterculiae]SIS20121.1 DNA-binding transcriptional regulator, LysR family [Williamsia sterculiae]
MLFRQLEYFVALAREQHFARAATACFVSQPALSEAIRKLEHELGVLLVRRGSSFEGLTPEGERLVLWARRILADRQAMQLEVTALRTGLTGELRMGVVPAAATRAAELADRFCAAHPLVRVRLESTMHSDRIVDGVRRFELDVGVVYLNGVDMEGLTSTLLYQEHHVLVVSSELLHPVGPDTTTWDTVKDLPLCLLHGRMRQRMRIDEVASQHGVVLEARLESDSVATLVAMVSTGRWASIVPRAWLPLLRTDPHMCVIELDGLTLGGPVALVRNDVRPAPILAAALEAVAVPRVGLTD